MPLKFRHKELTVTRELAAKLLKELNIRNRKISESHCWTLGKDMANGLFSLNPQPVVIHEDSKRASIRILDGQHRLTAASREAPESGVKMLFCFVQGNENEIVGLQNTIDSGKPRSASDRGGFQGLGIPQGYLEKAARLYQIIGQPIRQTDPEKGVFGWMDAPKASYSGCREFGHDNSVLLIQADKLAVRHYKSTFKSLRVGRIYLAMAYLVALMNGAEQEDLESFAAAANDSKSVLRTKLVGLWTEGHPFEQTVAVASKNASGIQYALVRDLLVAHLSGTLTSGFEPVLDIRQVDGTTLTEFEVQ